MRVRFEMNKRKLVSGPGPRAWLPAFVLLAVSFLLGSAAGFVMSSGFAGGDSAGAFLKGYLLSLEDAVKSSGTARLFWETGVYHVAVFLLGFTVFGAAAIPAVSALRGFTLTFAMATLVRLYSFSGAVAGLVLLGLTAVVSVPVFFVLAVDAMWCSAQLARTGLTGAPPAGPGIYSKAYFIKFLSAAVLLILISAGERALILSGLLELPVF